MLSSKRAQDAAKVEEEIKTMPNYFSDYDTTVHFISEDELKRDHSGIPHGGFVLRSGRTGWDGENSHLIEYSPEAGFKSGVYIKCAGSLCPGGIQTVTGRRFRMPDSL